MSVTPAPRGGNPFDSTGIERDAQDIAHYTGMASSLVTMLFSTVQRYPQAEALVEIGGRRLTYQQLWEQAAVVAGGLRELGVRHGDRVASLLPAGVDWVLAFLGAQLAGAVI
ncbi:MAG: AMP-binding protein, partial [Sciscionella sp.]